MMPHDPKGEDDEADDCTHPVDPLPSPFILSNGDSGVDTMQTSLGGMPTVPFSPNDVVAEEHEETPHEVVPDGEAVDEDKEPAWVGCVGLLILIIFGIYQALSEFAKVVGSVFDYLAHLH
jgi:hypothetical protein